MTIKAPREDGGIIQLIERLCRASENPVIFISSRYIIRLKLALGSGSREPTPK